MKWVVLGFLIVVPVLYLGPGKSFARTLTDTDTHQYLIDPIFDNLWFGLYGPDGKKYGWWNGNEFREGDNWIFEERSEIWMLDRVEADGRIYDDQIIIQKHTKEYFDIKNGFSLSKIESHTRFGDESRTTFATIVDGTAYVKVDHGGHISNFNVEGFLLSFHDVYALELLLRKYSDWDVGDEIKYSYYDPDTFQSSIETDVIMEIGETFRDGLPVEFYRIKTLPSDSRGSFEALLTKKGLPLKYIEATGYAVLEDEEVAKDGVSFGGITFQDSVIHLDKSIPDPNSASRIKMEIVGNYEGGIHSGYQQQVISADQGVYLVLGRDVGDPEKATAYEMQSNLAESASYPLQNINVQEMVKEVIGNANSDWEKIEKLVAYVDRFIVDDFSSNSLSVFEIIQKRKGDCSEHALLFNTMARAAGIPAREVRGLMYFADKKFGLHAWNEVLVGGTWHAVDSTWNKTETPITHIKFSSQYNIPTGIRFELVEVE